MPVVWVSVSLLNRARVFGFRIFGRQHKIINKNQWMQQFLVFFESSWSLGSPHTLHLSHATITVEMNRQKWIDGDNQITIHQPTESERETERPAKTRENFCKIRLFHVRFLSHNITNFDTPANNSTGYCLGPIKMPQMRHTTRIDKMWKRASTFFVCDLKYWVFRVLFINRWTSKFVSSQLMDWEGPRWMAFLLFICRCISCTYLIKMSRRVSFFFSLWSDSLSRITLALSQTLSEFRKGSLLMSKTNDTHVNYHFQFANRLEEGFKVVLR